jgi:hypothetical protein
VTRVLARFGRVVVIIASLRPRQASDKAQLIVSPNSNHTMAGYKRGGSRGAASFKKGFTKKRAGSDDEESAPRASKKAKGDEEDDSTPFVPELKTDSENQQYVGVSIPISSCGMEEG